MEDKNNNKSVRDTNLHELREHFEFVHEIVVAMGNNCPIVEWHSWKDVPGNVKKVVMDELLYVFDDEPIEQLMKYLEDALEGGYNRWHYEVLRNGVGSSK
ncbi:hypothetical protein D8674_008482 [Pyrus ussuriensis x Pyrus communis]|uniref:Uncharacterized protein n=1 Tax=Pyrus ussuriensis x Pyrus communis TaxID=2448454 RepID=A0A5N5HVX3_9ROSA|nr:hypothetical protein D8674_008482 [Pyrus ussuriensis x Pyrus communis]